jgi:hypothetical protein
MNISEPNDKVFKDIRYQNYGTLEDFFLEKTKFLDGIKKGSTINDNKYDINLIKD